jgi:parallel beta-helix repeat protein
MRTSSPLPIVFAVVALAIIGSNAWADQVSGTLTRTYVIVEDTDLIGNVTCAVPDGSACFSFGASGVELRLNGFSVTGRGDAITGCGGTSVATEGGVNTNSMNRVVVRGPGLIQRFRGDGIFVFASTDARIENLVISTTCQSGVRIAATSFNTLVQGITSVRSGNGTAACGGIWIIGHNSRVRLNNTQGNGYSDAQNNFGIGFTGTASGNVVEENTVSGNTNGILISPLTANNVIRDNIVVGNPAIQSANTRPTAQAVDILNLAPAGATTFERNICVTSVNAPCPATGGRPQQ